MGLFGVPRVPRQHDPRTKRALRRLAKFKGSRTLDVQTGSAGNTLAAETDLFSYTVLAGTAGTNKDTLDVEALFEMAATVAAKTIRAKVGSQTVGIFTANPGMIAWQLLFRVRVIRTAPATEEIAANSISSLAGLPQSVTRTAGTQDLAAAVVIKFTGQATNTNDIIQRTMHTNFVAAAT